MTSSIPVRKIALIALLAGAGSAWYLALPPRAVSGIAIGQGAPKVVRGAIHIHTDRSDGTGTVDEVAAAAARAGLNFVVFTDHGDATRKPDPPQYRSGVLCIDAVEISTDDGHVVALGVPQSPYPLGGEARDVIDDVMRLGGFSIAAHPGSPKPELRWTDWTLPIAGLEWLNGDSEWRDESRWTLTRALLTYPARQTETLVTLLDRPDSVLQQWDVLARGRQVVAIAGADAHARLGFRSLGEPYDNGASLHVPSYERVFRAFSNVLIGVSLAGNAETDAEQVIGAIRDGHVYSAIDGIGDAGILSFTATDGGMRAEAGDVMPIGRAITLRAEVRGREDARIALFKDGVARAESGPLLEHIVEPGTPGVYRVEVSLPDAPGQPGVPWLLSNPIYVGERTNVPAVAQPPPAKFDVRYADGPATAWTVETSPASKAALDVVPAERGTQLALRYAVGGAASASPYAAFVLHADRALAEYDRLIFTARADRPTRVSVQLREPSGVNGERWHRSVFIGTEPRDITVYFRDLRPLTTARAQPMLANVDSILFVLDTVNTALGGSGRIWMDDVKYAR
ncbi:MAG TPA: CehA/McbA family metallohydrolase [Vicinamibacterales bacterium]